MRNRLNLDFNICHCHSLLVSYTALIYAMRLFKLKWKVMDLKTN